MCLLIKIHPLSYILNYLKAIKKPEVVPVKMSMAICTSLHCVFSFVTFMKSTVLTNILLDKKEHLFRQREFHSKQSLFMFNLATCFGFGLKPLLS
jgi:hypothetical protein